MEFLRRVIDLIAARALRRDALEAYRRVLCRFEQDPLRTLASPDDLPLEKEDLKLMILRRLKDSHDENDREGLRSALVKLAMFQDGVRPGERGLEVALTAEDRSPQQIQRLGELEEQKREEAEWLQRVMRRHGVL